MIVNRSQGRTARLSLFFASLATILFASVAPAAEIVGSARLNVERESHTATLLGKGTVLLVGGRNAGGPLAVAEIYDPSTRTFSVAGSSLEARADHAAVRLADGRVLVIGGRRDVALASTEIFDPKTNTFEAGPSLTHSRFGHTATLLPDGRVVVIGGDATGCAEIYEPSTGTFKELEQCLAVPRRLHTAVVLRDGNVLVAGGVGADGTPLASAEILDLQTLSFSAAPIPMLASRSRLTLRLLPDGKVQAIGGDDEATMELFNPDGRYFTSLGHLGQDPQVLAAALRNTGRAALIGSPASSRPSLVRLAADGVELASGGDVLDRSSYTLTELPGANTAILIGGLTAAGAPQQRAVLFSSSSATVTTDKTDYAPGETVTITGTGWLPGETVTLNIHRDTNNPPDTVLSAVADLTGNITNSEYVVQEYDLGVTFLLTATGQTSGFTAQTTFTDGNVRVRTNAEGITFDLDWATYTDTTCSGTAADSDTEDDVGFSGGDRFTKGVGNTESISLTAETFSDQGGPFVNWTSETPVNPSTPANPTTALTICVPGFAGGGTREYVANYDACVNPSITVGGQPVSQTVCPGSSASFTVGAAGTNLSYQWRKDGSPLSNGGNISGATSATLTINPATAADNGSYTVVITGNCGSPVTSAAATLTVSDTTAPKITAPADSSAFAGATCQAAVPDYTADTTADDNCGTVTLTQSPAAGTLVGFGPHNVTVTADDGNGNTATDTVVFTVNDNTAPTITAPADSSAFADASCQAAVPDYTAGTTAADNCGTVTLTQSPAAGTLVGFGPHNVTVTANDGHGNSASDTVVFTVNDNTAPTITAPNDAAFQCVGDVPAASPLDATAADNCGTATVTFTESSNGGAGTTASPLVITRTYTANDGHGNTTSDSQT
ncbi:MAG: immunoglobulin domain-containing protein, partial [Acidobacteriota bacterium]|nr:immunoglobulin domain-containing protein [Acidobacteriota bacterium]